MPFDWDSSNIEHISRHDVTPGEAEQVIVNDPLDGGVVVRNGEERQINLGETDEGRVLFVVTTVRGAKIRVVTAHPADRKARKHYLEAKALTDDEDSRDP